MAYETHLRWRVQGYLGADPGPEIFSTGFQTDVPADFAGLPTVAQQTNVAAAIVAWWATAAAHLSNEVFAKTLTCSLIGPDGKVVVDGTGAYVQRLVPCVVSGAYAGSKHPYQIAQVLTLVTTRHGARGKGRMYLPLPCYQLTTGRIDPSERSDTLAAAATAFGSINSSLAADAGVGPFHVAVASSMGETHPVTQLRMGVVLDTQRRRRDSLAENYSTVTI